MHAGSSMTPGADIDSAASLSNAGIKFYCKNCGREGHRRHYCPELKGDSIDRRFRCRVCGEKGHNRRTCKKSRLNGKPMSATIQHRCTICGGKGHSSRNCSKSGNVLSLNLIKGDRMTNESSRVRQYRCRICEENGHNRRNCPNIDTKVNHTSRRRTYSCKLCHEKGHNSRTCPVIKMNNLKKNPPGSVNQ